ncbi:hypothetical protein GCM10023193_77880 [Planotetraspora kaengkrachanensis]|uniref:Uncharacterized protein n=1 Tax=Planotetraspora kaengkrachanensis TaxID=575193 RepID=A0A8J3Q0W1_9ACTN|nr:hypothetical protein Pka01_77020 [Planotetraspora kaengkrachanensis]
MSVRTGSVTFCYDPKIGVARKTSLHASQGRAETIGWLPKRMAVDRERRRLPGGNGTLSGVGPLMKGRTTRRCRACGGGSQGSTQGDGGGSAHSPRLERRVVSLSQFPEKPDGHIGHEIPLYRDKLGRK